MKKTSKSLTCEFIFNSWLESLSPENYKPNTITGYKGAVNNYFVPYFKEMPASELQSFPSLQAFFGELQKTRNQKENLHSSKNLHNFKNILSKCLDFAVYQGWLSFNISDHIHIPENNEKALEHIPEQCVIRIQAELDSNTDNVSLAIQLILHTGIDLGELLALTWSDIDLQKQSITVLKQQVSSSSGRSVELYASDNSRHRTIPLSKSLIQYLSSFPQDRLKTVIYRESRAQYDNSAFGKIIASKMKAMGVTASATVLRNTFGMALFRTGVPYIEIMRVMGYSLKSNIARKFLIESRC